MFSQSPYRQASIKTAEDLRSVAQSLALQEVSQLSLPEIDALVNAVSSVVPAGNVPGIILSGLARLPGRQLPDETVRRDINLLFKGVESALDKAMYGALFAGPAAIIWGYQNLLKLAGKEPKDSFPEGVWQFYVEYALREDTARHTCETGDFDAMLAQHQITLSPVDRTTAWLMAAITVLHQYPELLANEWRERVFLALLADLTAAQPDAVHYAALYSRWQRQRPFRRDKDAAANENFASYRRRKFDAFLAAQTRDLDMSVYQSWTAAIEARREELRAYKQQLSIHTYLAPGPYHEERVQIPRSQLQIGLIYQGRYYLLPACAPGGSKPAEVEQVRELVTAVFAQPTGAATVKLHHLATMKRQEFANLRRSLNTTMLTSLERLQQVPILLNADLRAANQPLPRIRQAERGVGDHALTIFDTGKTAVFDLSHIFFDGGWGIAVAEILTSEAMSWAVYLNQLPPPQINDTVRVKPLSFPFESRELRFVEQSAHVTPEVSVETDKASLSLLLTTRKLFEQRNDLLRLDVNDLLVLYRAIHAATYEPDAGLVSELEALVRTARHGEPARAVLDEIVGVRPYSPAMLMLVDASRHTPRERLYPLVFEVPLRELDLVGLHSRCLAALTAYQEDRENRAAAYAEFDELQRTYLAALAGFGLVLSHARELGTAGRSAGTGAIKLLANMPPPLQRLLDAVPDRLDLLNDLIRGRELFSNLGQVVSGSSLTRYSPAKDDSGKKHLAWGVIADDSGVLHITLRDFRPYVAALLTIGHKSLAVRLAQHFLDGYATGLNAYLHDLRRITYASRETRMASPGIEPD